MGVCSTTAASLSLIVWPRVAPSPRSACRVLRDSESLQVLHENVQIVTRLFALQPIAVPPKRQSRNERRIGFAMANHQQKRIGTHVLNGTRQHQRAVMRRTACAVECATSR